MVNNAGIQEMNIKKKKKKKKAPIIDYENSSINFVLRVVFKSWR